MRRFFLTSIVTFGMLAWIGVAWAIVGETTVTATDGGQPIPGAKVTITFKTDTGRRIRRITVTDRKKIVIPDGTRKVDITVTTKRDRKTETDIDVGLLAVATTRSKFPAVGRPERALRTTPAAR